MLNRTDGDLAALEQAFTNDPSHIAIVMLGAQDRYNVGPRRASGQQGNWRNDYAARVDRRDEDFCARADVPSIGSGSPTCAAGRTTSAHSS